MAAYRVVRESRSNLEAWDEIEPVLQLYADSLQLDIHVSNPHGNASNIETEEGRLYLRFWSTPSGRRSRNMEYAFGIELGGGQTDAMRPDPVDDHGTELGQNIVDGRGNTVAQYFGGTLFVLFDLPHGRNAEKLMDKIMQEFEKISGITEEERRERKEARRLELLRSTPENFKKLYEDALRNAIERTDRELLRIQESVEDYQREIVRLARMRRDTLELRSHHNAQLNNTDLEVIEKQLESLREYGTLVVRPDHLEIDIGQVDVKFGDVTYDIGEFTIQIYTSREGSSVLRCINRTRSVGSYYHPHVYSSGSCCLGNILSTLPKAIGNMDYSSAMMLVDAFLRRPNTDGGYLDILMSFPVKKT